MNNFSAWSNRRILIVDDNHSIHEDFQKILEKEEEDNSLTQQLESELFGEIIDQQISKIFDLDSAFQGEEAIDMVEKACKEDNPYALAFVDVRMPPGIDGIKTIEKLWEVDSHLQIVVCSAYSDYTLEEIHEHLGLKSDSFLILKKPFESIEIQQIAFSLVGKWNITFELEEKNLSLLKEIAERKQAEEALRESEERVRTILTTLPAPISITRKTDGKFLYINEYTSQLFNISSEQLLNQHIIEFYPEHFDREYVIKTIENDGHITNFEIAFQSQHNTNPVHTLLSARPITFNQEEAIVTTFIDITTRKQAEEALRESETRFRTILSTIPTPIFIARQSDTEILYCNKYLALTIGIPVNHLIGKKTRDLFAESMNHDEISQFLERYGFIDNYEICIKTPLRKKDYYSEIFVRTLQYQDEKAIIISLFDITERKQAEEALRESEESLRNVLVSLPTPVSISRKASGEIIYINEHMSLVTELSTEELLGQQARQFYSEFLPREELLFLLEGKGHIENMELSFRLPSKDEPFEAIVSMRTIMYKGEEVIVTTYLDITERKKTELALRESEERFRTILETLPAPVSINRKSDGEFIYANDYMTYLTAVPPSSLIGSKVDDYYPESLNRTEILERLDKQGYIENLEVQLVNPFQKNTYIYTLVSARPFKYEGEEAIITAYIDITERKRVENALQESQEIAKAMINATQDLVILLDSEGVIFEINKAAADIFAESPDELLGANIFDILEADISLDRKQKLIEVRSTKQSIRYIEKDINDKIYLTTSYPILDKDEQVFRIVVFLHDITDIKKAEEELQKKEELLRTVVTNVPVFLWALDKDANFTLFEGKGLQALGFKPGEYVGKSIYEAFPHVPYIKDEVQRAFSGQSFKSILEIDTLFFETLLNPVTDSDNNVIGVIGVSADITQRKNAEDALIDNLFFLQELLDAIPIPVFYKNSKGLFIGCNKAYETFHGVDRVKILGKSVYDLFPNDFADKYYEMDMKLLDDLESQVYEYSGISANGEIRNVVYYKAAFMTSAGELGGVIGAFIDVTEERKAQEALIESERIVSGLFNASTDPVLLMDNNAHILKSNESAAKSFEKTNSDLINIDLKELIDIDNYNQAKKYLDEVISSQKPCYYEARRKDLWFTHSVYPVLDFDAKVCKIVHFSRDITLAKKMEEELTRLTTKIHNSLKHKLESMRNLMSLYFSSINEESGAGLMEYLTGINKLISHCSTETKNILFVIVNKECDLQRLIDEIHLRAELSLSSYNISYFVREHGVMEANQTIKMKAVHYILDVYSELLNNIVKYSKTPKVDIDVEIIDQTISITVIDHGIGFDYEKQKKKRDGYGLKLLDQITEQNDGTLLIESLIGKGTAVNISVDNYF